MSGALFQLERDWAAAGLKKDTAVMETVPPDPAVIGIGPQH